MPIASSIRPTRRWWAQLGGDGDAGLGEQRRQGAGAGHAGAALEVGLQAGERSATWRAPAAWEVTAVVIAARVSACSHALTLNDGCARSNGALASR